ncbi:Hypothetical protein A7982_04606 [Minicystis rosea]|nr:Hypothetical protein A7982_04606 [Minicystis rosea]
MLDALVLDATEAAPPADEAPSRSGERLPHATASTESAKAPSKVV